MAERTKRRDQLVKRRRYVGHSQESLAFALDVSVSSVAQWERGITSPTPRHRRSLASLLEVSMSELDLLLDPDAEPVEPAALPFPGWLKHFTTMEQLSSRVKVVELTLVHGLLQTRSYAEAVVASFHLPLSQAAIESRVDYRLARQKALTREERPLGLDLLLDESALLRPVGGPGVMVGQIDRLLTMMERSNVEIRILPLEAATYAVPCPFCLYFADDSLTPFLLTTENVVHANYIEVATIIESHLQLFAHLEEVALSRDRGIERLAKIRDSYTDRARSSTSASSREHGKGAR